MAASVLCHLLGCPYCHDSPAFVPPLGPKVDDPIGALDHIEVVLDDQQCVPLVGKSLQHPDKFINVFKVQAGGRLVKDVKRTRGSRRAGKRASRRGFRIVTVIHAIRFFFHSLARLLASPSPLRQLRRQLDPLRLATR